MLVNDVVYVLAGPALVNFWLIFLDSTVDGAGMAVMFAITAVLGAAMSLTGCLFSAVRNIEGDLPDYDQKVLAIGTAQAT